MPDPWLTNFNGPNSSGYLPLWQMPVAYNQSLAILVPAIFVKLNVVHHLVFDQNMSVLEGSLGVLPRRILVTDDDIAAARQVLTDAGLAHELRPDGS